MIFLAADFRSSCFDVIVEEAKYVVFCLVLVAYSAIVEGHDWGDRDGHVRARAGF